MPRERDVNAAKRAQRLRLGSDFGKGKKKRCEGGKSCGATYIARNKFCLVGLSLLSQDLGSIREDINGKSGVPPKFKPPTTGRVPDVGKEEEGIGKAKRIIGEMEVLRNNGQIKDYDGVVKADSVNWSAGVGKGYQFVDSGVFGAFVTVPPERLAKGLEDKFPDGVGVKYGRVKPREVELLQRVGETGAGPKLIAARLDGEYKGMVAMERVPGEQLRKVYRDGTMKFEDISDAYVKAISKLHREGIAHNDAHFGNAILQPNGKIKFVDFGQSDTRASSILNEIEKIIDTRWGSIFQVQPLVGPIVTKVRENYSSVRGEVSSFLSSVSGMSQGERDKESKRLIDRIYEGVL